ncbi:hypothetical protein F4556_000153 [Kitasatospora gansuensis]|uniref:Uncharacterized protein n=1 Tax=Kitasatospora gansuensis TaxID=258050 RepID=A0A7W7S7B7_9ACTN|nr:hypothetical protein [Kitasatospora gansuensis]
MAGFLGQLPAALAFDAGQQSEDERPCRRSWFDPSEAARDAGHGLVEHRPPTGRVHAMTGGHRTIFSSPHNL